MTEKNTFRGSQPHRFVSLQKKVGKNCIGASDDNGLTTLKTIFNCLHGYVGIVSDD